MNNFITSEKQEEVTIMQQCIIEWTSIKDDFKWTEGKSLIEFEKIFVKNLYKTKDRVYPSLPRIKIF